MNKITKFITRYKNARRLGLSYFRTSTFHLPETIDFHSDAINLEFPDEKGIFIDFLSIFLDDDYGLTEFRKNKISKIIDIGANVGFFSIASRFFSPIRKFMPMNRTWIWKAILPIISPIEH